MFTKEKHTSRTAEFAQKIFSIDYPWIGWACTLVSRHHVSAKGMYRQHGPVSMPWNHFFLWKRGERIPTMLYFKELLGAHKNHSFSRITKFCMWQTATPQACVLLAGEHQSEEGWFHVSEDDVVSVLLQLPGTQQQEGVVGRRRDVIWPWQLPHTRDRSSRGDSDP